MTTKTKRKTPPDEVVREIQSEPLSRSLTVIEGSIDVEKRTAEVAVSSEYPFRRHFGIEILDHSPESVDLRRLKAGAPLLDQHGEYRQIGVVEDAWLDGDRKLRARVRFSRSAEAEPVWQDVVDLIRRHISTRYLIHEMVLESERGGVDTYRVTRWEPFEVSSVSIPVDPTVGVGRSLDQQQHTITVKETRMTKPNQNPGADDKTPGTNTPTGGEQQRGMGAAPAEPRNPQTDVIAQERQRVADITAMGDRFNQRSLAQDAIQQGYSVDQVRAMLLERINPQAAPAGGAQGGDLPTFGGQQRKVTSEGLGVSEKEAGQYSLMRALNAAATNDWSKAGFERELSIATADALGKEARGFFVPHDMLMRAMAHHPSASMRRGLEVGAAGKGGELVATDLRIDQFIDILRNKTVIAQLGARMLSGLEGDLDLPKKVSGSNFYWLGEKEDVNLSDFDLATLPMKPKTIAGGIPVTRKLRKQAALSVEALIVDDLISGIGVAIDLAMLMGTGSDNQPLGLLNQTGLGSVEYPADGITWGKIVDMVTKVATYNADQGALAYLTDVVQRGAAQQTEKFANTGKEIWGDNGRVNGYRAEATNQMPTDTWLFGDFSQVVIGMWGVLDLKPDPYALAGQDGLIVRVFQDVDANVRRPESFCVATKATAG